MYSRALLIILALATSLPFVSTCEGECVVEITRAFLGNYTSPIRNVFKELGQQIAIQLLPPSQRPTDPTVFMEPFLKGYQNSSYDMLETAIFPSYFHGKCQRFSKDGQDPPGCPNPDCPVVCGTPGSMVHFYSTLRFIVFNTTRTTLEMLMTPGNPAFDQANALVLKARLYGARRRDLAATSHSPALGGISRPHMHITHDQDKRSHSHHFRFAAGKYGMSVPQSRDSPDLASILSQFDSLFAKACGGMPYDGKGGLPKCSWENDMKKFILSFP